MPPFLVRRLGRADLAAFRDLNAMFGRVFAEPDTYGAKPPSDAQAERLLGKEHIAALVAEADGEVVGGLVAYELEKLEQARSEFYVYDLAVEEKHRRRGVATALIDALRAIAAERGAWTILIQADHGDDPAIALYTKLGRREDVMHFDIPVGPMAR